jgi:hypothetical protein
MSIDRTSYAPRAATWCGKRLVELALVEVGKAIRRVRLAAMDTGDSLDGIARTRAVEETLLVDYAIPLERLNDMEFRRTATIAVRDVLGHTLVEVDVVKTF